MDPNVSKALLEYSQIALLVVAVVNLAILYYRRGLREYLPLTAFIALITAEQVVSVPVMFFRKNLGISKLVAYNVVFYTGWITFVIEYVLVFLVAYMIFSKAMTPFPGLQRIGKLVFRWFTVVSLILSAGMVFGSHIGNSFWQSLDGQIHQSAGILALCLLLFVTFSTRQLGITYRSRLFGVALGFGIWSTTALIGSAMLASRGALSVYSPVYLWFSVGCFATQLVWAAYFALPEPAREMITLPTTSPFFLWNKIAEALGEAPPQVVVGGFKPEMLAEGEIQMIAASNRMRSEQEQNARAQAAANRIKAVHPLPLAMTGR